MTARLALKFGPSRIARLGAWSLAFFAMKGLAWLLVPLIAMVLA